MSREAQSTAMTLRNLREEKKLSQEQLALMAGVSTRTIQRIESGYKASSETLKALASVLEIDVSTLKEEIDVTEQPDCKTDNKPKNIAFAVCAIYLTIAISAITTLFNRLDGVISEQEFSAYMLGFALFCFLPYFINRGSDLARFIYLLIAITGTLGGLANTGYEGTGVDIISAVFLYPIGIFSFIMLYTKKSNQWFRHHKKGFKPAQETT